MDAPHVYRILTAHFVASTLSKRVPLMIHLSWEKEYHANHDQMNREVILVPRRFSRPQTAGFSERYMQVYWRVEAATICPATKACKNC